MVCASCCSEYLRAGQTAKASKLMTRDVEFFPPYLYELALIDLIAGQMVTAATRLRRAVIANSYVAEILCGMPDPLPLAIWHGTNFAEPEIARDYVQDYGKLWRETPSAMPFLRWLHTHPPVLSERAGIFGLKERLLWEHDAPQRQSLFDEEERLTGQINDSLSKIMVVKRSGRFRRLIDPWLHSSRP